jgi:hypothetical protein
MMRKKKIHESRSNEARRKRRIARSARKKGEKSAPNGTSDVGSEIRLELGNGPVDEAAIKQKLLDLVNDPDPRVRLPALKLMIELGKQAQPSDTPKETDDYTGPVELITDAVEAARVYQQVMMGRRDGGPARDPRSFRILSSEFEGQRAELVYQEMVKAGEVNNDDVPPELRAEAKRAYLKVLGFRGRDLGEAPAAPTPPAQQPKPESMPAATALEERPEKRRPENVVALEFTCSLPEHQPIVDSKCAFCRQLWVKAQEAAEDARQREQHVHVAKADSVCPGCKALWVRS